MVKSAGAQWDRMSWTKGSRWRLNFFTTFLVSCIFHRFQESQLFRNQPEQQKKKTSIMERSTSPSGDQNQPRSQRRTVDSSRSRCMHRSKCPRLLTAQSLSMLKWRSEQMTVWTYLFLNKGFISPRKCSPPAVHSIFKNVTCCVFF